MAYEGVATSKHDAELEALLIDTVDCVVDGHYIKKHQSEDEAMQKLIQSCMNDTNEPDYQILNVMGTRLLTYHKRVVIPKLLCDVMVEWYHTNLVHPGAKHQYHTMKPGFYWSGMERTIVDFVKKCMTCKRAKLHGGEKSYGKLPPRRMQIVDPFDVIHVDTMGPYGDVHQYVLTVIDEATRWLEVSIQKDNRGTTTNFAEL